MRKTLPIALVCVAMLASTAVAGKFNKVLSLGSVAPAWPTVSGTDDKQHSLQDYKDAKAVVVIFTCNHCPVAQQYEQRLVDLQRDYQAKGVQVVAICVNSGEEDSLEHMKQRAAAQVFNFPYLSDPSQAAGKMYGAQKTPEAFVLDADRKVVYMGAIDDNWMDATEVKKPYVRNAIDAVLSGKAPEVQEIRATGCGIEYGR
jgi:peroxiredoxin